MEETEKFDNGLTKWHWHRKIKDRAKWGITVWGKDPV